MGYKIGSPHFNSVDKIWCFNVEKDWQPSKIIKFRPVTILEFHIALMGPNRDELYLKVSDEFKLILNTKLGRVLYGIGV